MIDLFAIDLCNDSLEPYDDIKLHLLGHQYETKHTNYFMAHLENATQNIDKDPFPLNTDHTHTVTSLVEVPIYTEALHAHINPLVTDNMYIHIYNIFIHSIYPHIHKYKTNKIWFKIYLYRRPEYSGHYKGSTYQEIQYKFPGIVTALLQDSYLEYEKR